MSEKPSTLAHDMSCSLTKVTQALPEVMSHFSALASSAIEEGALSAKIKALCTLSIAIQAKSSECITYHVENAIRQHVTRDELLEIVTISAYMGGGPGLMAAEDALSYYDASQAANKA